MNKKLSISMLVIAVVTAPGLSARLYAGDAGFAERLGGNGVSALSSIRLNETGIPEALPPVPAAKASVLQNDAVVLMELDKIRASAGYLEMLARFLKAMESSDIQFAAPAAYTSGIDKVQKELFLDLDAIETALALNDAARVNHLVSVMRPLPDRLMALVKSIEGDPEFSGWDGRNVARTASDLKISLARLYVATAQLS